MEHYSFVLNVDYVDSIIINYGEFLSRLRGEFSDFSCWILRKVLLAFEYFDLIGRVATVEFVQEGTLVSERYKLQLLEGLMLLVLVGLIRLLRVVRCIKLIYFFLELLLVLLRVRVAFIALFLRRLVLIWVGVTIKHLLH